MEQGMENFWKEGMDLKRLVLCLSRRLWLPAAAGMMGAALGAAVYLCITIGFAGPEKYQVFTQYYITFDPETYGDIADYYNAYTWGEILKTDRIVDLALDSGVLPEGTDKEALRACVIVGQMNDIRLMPVTFTSQDPGFAVLAAGSYQYALDVFARSLTGLVSMERWQQDDPVPVVRGERWMHAALLGGVLCAVCAFLGCLFYYILDDSFWLEKDFEARYPWPVLGIWCGKETFRRELTENARYLLGDAPSLYLIGLQKHEVAPDIWTSVKEVLAQGRQITPLLCDMTVSEAECEHMRAGNGAVLLVPAGKPVGRMTDHLLRQLEIQKVPVQGVILAAAGQEWFLTAYYGLKK